jgi:hypothetical protein
MNFFFRAMLRLNSFLEKHLWFLLPRAPSPKTRTIRSLQEQLSKLSYEKEYLEIDMRALKRELELDQKDRDRWKADAKTWLERAKEAQDERFLLRHQLVELKLVLLQKNLKAFENYFEQASQQRRSSQIIPLFHLSEDAPKELFDAVYRALAKKNHPDTGNGSQDFMKELNQIKDQVYAAKSWK